MPHPLQLWRGQSFSSELLWSSLPQVTVLRQRNSHIRRLLRAQEQERLLTIDEDDVTWCLTISYLPARGTVLGNYQNKITWRCLRSAAYPSARDPEE